MCFISGNFNGSVTATQNYFTTDYATINIGLPSWPSQQVDTLFWNQLAELGYVMCRESADNDSQYHLLPSRSYHVSYPPIRLVTSLPRQFLVQALCRRQTSTTREAQKG
jgi:hypothetical protein